jgi:primosomal protein N' (replication factor Y)
LVGIVDADVALNLPDFRAAERSFQILTQVSGRAGRADRPGRVFLQTFHPDNPTLLAAARNDSELFYERELQQRREAQYPPFVRLIQIRVSGRNREQVVGSIRQIAKTLAKGIPPAEGRILGPAPCPIERIRDRCRWHLLVKTAAYPKVQPKIRALLGSPGKRTLPSGLRMLINVDPMEMM